MSAWQVQILHMSASCAPVDIKGAQNGVSATTAIYHTYMVQRVQLAFMATQVKEQEELCKPSKQFRGSTGLRAAKREVMNLRMELCQR